MKPLGAIAKKQAPFDAAVGNASATTIADNLKKASSLCPAGSGGGESKAKPEIWTDAAGFEKGMKDAHAAAVALQSVKDEAAFGPALGALAPTPCPRRRSRRTRSIPATVRRSTTRAAASRVTGHRRERRASTPACRRAEGRSPPRSAPSTRRTSRRA